MSGIKELKEIIAGQGLAAYIVPTSDFHGSEYVGEHFQARKYLTGFTGSAGTLVIVGENAYLFTDGRYHLQAEAELNGSDIILMKSGLEGVPSVSDFLAESLNDGDVIGFDGRVVSISLAEKILGAGEKKGKHLSFSAGEDLVDSVWPNRPEIASKDITMLSYKATGATCEEKIEEVAGELAKKSIDYFVVTALDEIAWLLNIRGRDVECNPVMLGYLVLGVEDRSVTVFIDKGNQENVSKLSEMGLVVRGYGEVYDYIKEKLSGNVFIDNRTANYRIRECLAGANIVTGNSPIYLAKAVKNQAELSGEVVAHLRDGVAMVKFLHWLSKEEDKASVSEISAAEKLLEFRQAQEGFIEESFEPIIAYKDHGAIIHYSATSESNRPLGNEGLLLMDTGAHYDVGTTDITRTIALGPVSEEEKKAYTLVLASHLRLLNAQFIAGTGGSALDLIAREPLWKHGMDYLHGTGHGIGHILNVHEGPNTISFRKLDKSLDEIKPGMITSCEPGYYKDGEYGIRHESLMVARLGEKNKYGQFLYHEPLTMVPFDVSVIDWDYLSNEDVENLKKYHRMVYERISPFLAGEELEWLGEACGVE